MNSDPGGPWGRGRGRRGARFRRCPRGFLSSGLVRCTEPRSHREAVGSGLGPGGGRGRRTPGCDGGMLAEASFFPSVTYYFKNICSPCSAQPSALQIPTSLEKPSRAWGRACRGAGVRRPGGSQCPPGSEHNRARRSANSSAAASGPALSSPSLRFGAGERTCWSLRTDGKGCDAAAPAPAPVPPTHCVHVRALPSSHPPTLLRPRGWCNLHTGRPAGENRVTGNSSP